MHACALKPLTTMDVELAQDKVGKESEVLTGLLEWPRMEEQKWKELGMA